MFGLELQEWNLYGIEAVDLLLRGHVVRRKAWVDGVYIRITNEAGFSADGKAIVPEGTAIYTIGTHGYFLHLAHSAQPLKEPRTFCHQGHPEIASRSSEGLNMLFANDWEDYGFMSSQDFNDLRINVKALVRQLIKESNDKVLERKAKECQQ